MDRVLQAQKNALQAFQENIEPGRVSALMAVFTGTNAATFTNGLAELGDFTVKRNGRTYVNRSVEAIANIGDIRAGSNVLNSTVASTFEASVLIPFYEEGIPNALNIKGDSELNVSYSPNSAVAAQWDDLSVEIYAVTAFTEELYNYYILGDDQVESGAVNSRPYQLNQDHITAVYVSDPDDVVTSLGLRQNGVQIFSEQSWLALEAGTLYSNRLEVGTFTMVELQTYTPGKARSYLNKNSILDITTSGAGTVEITKTAIEPNSNFVGKLNSAK